MNVRAAIEEKNRDRQKVLQRETRGNQEKYEESRKKASKVCHRKKREWIKRKVEEMEELWEQNEERNFYLNVQKSRRGYQPRLNVCKNKEGEIIGEGKRILD
jgi:hypothetical protein